MVYVLQGNCISIEELDVRILNYPNWTSITQVMGRFLELPQAALFWPNLLSRFLGSIYGWKKKKKRIWTRILKGTCSSIRELDVRLLNHPNQTSITQAMVRFSGLLQLRLFNDLCPDFCHNWYMIVVYHCLN